MLLRCFLGVDEGIFDAISVSRTTERLGTESEWDAGTEIIGHFLCDHLGIDGTPVPLMLVRHVEPSNAVEDDGLDLDASGTVLVPDTLDPKIDVDVLFVVVDEC